MTTHQERMERMDRHLQVLREFHIAELKDHIEDTQRDLDDAVARGNKLVQKRYEEQLAELKVKLERYEAELRAAA